MKADKLLEQKAELFRRKNKQYGSTYKEFGKVMLALFPEGIACVTEKSFTEFGIFHMLVHKIHRMSKTLGNPEKRDTLLDSVRDLQVYGAMLEELITEEEENGNE